MGLKIKGQAPNDQHKVSQRIAKTGSVQEMIERVSQEEGVMLRLEVPLVLVRRDFQRRIIIYLPRNIPKSGIVIGTASSLAHGDPRFRAALAASTIAVVSVKKKSLSREIHLHQVHKVVGSLTSTVISVFVLRLFALHPDIF
jgi:hypothetical protein